MNEQLFLEIDQIILTLEAKELMIGISAKEAEEKNTEVVFKNRHSIRLQYWELALEIFQKVAVHFTIILALAMITGFRRDQG